MAHEVFRLGDRARAIALAERAAGAEPGAFGNPAPLAAYALAVFLDAEDRPVDAAAVRTRARAADPRLAFPHGLDDLDALEAALAADPGDDRARGYLGCWLLDAGRTTDALDALDAAIGARHGGGPHTGAREVAGHAPIDHALDPPSGDPVVWRNAAVALVNSGGDLDEADRRYRVALDLSPADPRLVFERDQLAALRGIAPEARLSAIVAAGAGALVRDDLAIAYANLLVDVDRADDALAFLDARAFQPFEGGEGQVIRVFDRATAIVARGLLERGEARTAADLLRRGIRAPEHLGEGRHPAEPVAERFVLLGDAEAALGDRAAAEAAWRRALGGGPHAAGDRLLDERDAWVGVARLRLGDRDGAGRVWAALEARADALEQAPDRVDYFATSLPELLLFPVDTAERRRAQAARLRDLAAWGRRGAEAAAA